MASFEPAAVSLELPKFKLTSSHLLNDGLSSLGMGIAFDSRRADFSPMTSTGKRELWISKAIHKAVLEVNETGTEAAAGTVIEMKKGGLATSLTVDRPFLFAVRDTHSGAILFMALVNDPTA